MNKLDFNQVGGFPMTTNILNELQKAFTLFNGLGKIVGELGIISGCETIGSNVTDGVVFINGEVLEFRGGLAQTKVIVKEDITNLMFQNGNSNPVIKTRYATFGTGVTFNLWADFKRGYETKNLLEELNNKVETSVMAALLNRLNILESKAAVFQSGGGMLFWNKPANQIPTGWAEVVDWRGRMPIGMDVTQPEFNTLGETGGAKSHTNTIAEMAEHDHDMTYGYTGADSSVKVKRDPDGDAVIGTMQTGKKGDGTAYSIMNPYRTVLFIEYTL